MKILFVTATRIGDAVLSTGLLSHLVGQYPGARFTIAAGPPAAPLFVAVPGLERVIAVTKRPWSLHWAAAAGSRCRTALGSGRRSARLGAGLDAARRRAPGHGQGRPARASRAAARPAVRPGTAAAAASVDRAGASARRRGAAAAGSAGAGDRAGRELARQAVARRAIRRTGAAADGEQRSVCRRPDRGHGGGARTRAGGPAARLAAAPAGDRPGRPHRSA